MMKRLAEDTGMDIWICTGLRGTAKHRYLPRYAFEESDRQLADRWIREIREGIGGIRARFVKLGIDGGINGASALRQNHRPRLRGQRMFGGDDAMARDHH